MWPRACSRGEGLPGGGASADLPTGRFWSPAHCGFGAPRSPCPTCLGRFAPCRLRTRTGAAGPAGPSLPAPRQGGSACQERECYLEQTSPRPVNLLFSPSQGSAGGGPSHGLGRHARAAPGPRRWPPEVGAGPYLAAVHAAFQVAGTQHGGGDDATIHLPVVAKLVRDQRHRCVVEDGGGVTCVGAGEGTCREGEPCSECRGHTSGRRRPRPQGGGRGPRGAPGRPGTRDSPG